MAERMPECFGWTAHVPREGVTMRHEAPVAVESYHSEMAMSTTGGRCAHTIALHPVVAGG